MSKTVLIKADKARNLKYTVNSLIELEQATGKPVMGIMEDSDEISFTLLRALLYFGLKWEDKDLTLEKTGEVMDCIMEKEGMAAIAQAIGKAIQLGLGGSAMPPSE